MKNLKNKKAITLVALVITIIVLLILAGITISLTLGQDGILKMAEQAGQNYTDSEKYEKEQLAGLTNETDSLISSSRDGNGAQYTVIYDNSTGEASGTLTDDINNYDMLIAIFRNANYSAESIVFVPEKPTVGFNFHSGSNVIYGSFVFNGNTFETKISKCSFSDWNSKYVIYKVIGVKF